MSIKIRGRRVIYKDKHPNATNLYGMYVSKDGYEYWKTYAQVRSGLGVVALTKDKKIVLIREHKSIFMKYFWQVPTGYIERNSSVTGNAKRELEEETGYVANKYRHLFTFYPSMGSMKQTCYMILAENAVRAKKPKFDKGEYILPAKEFTINEAVRMVERGEILHDYTIMAIYYLASKLKR